MRLPTPCRSAPAPRRRPLTTPLFPPPPQWVVAHECGHNAFSNNRTLQDAVGYAYHSLLLVPYYSWQRSHAVHHSRTNHLTEGETHCPYTADSRPGQVNIAVLNAIGRAGFTVVQLVTHLLVGWPAYILWGATGGPSRGVTNHFWPSAPFSEALWPGTWKQKVLKSDIGIIVTLAGLAFWASQTSLATVGALYVAPYLVTNAWLVLYTWLQHTDTDVPHYEGEDWNYVRGAFLTIDRPYGALLDFVHHRIGSTHVAHHVDSSIPHYHAVEATEALKKAFPHMYLYDPTPIMCAVASPSHACPLLPELLSHSLSFFEIEIWVQRSVLTGRSVCLCSRCTVRRCSASLGSA